MSLRPTQTQQIAALTEQVTHLAERVESLASRPRPTLWETLTLDRRTPSMPADRQDLAGVLRYHERATQRGPVIYYALIGALYLRAALAVFVGTSSLYLLAGPLRLLIVCFYLAVGMGNFSCIVIPTRRNQIGMIGPTVVAAALVMALSIFNAIVLREYGAIISIVFFWIPMIIGHIAWGLTVPGRVDQLTFTRRLLAASQETSP